MAIYIYMEIQCLHRIIYVSPMRFIEPRTPIQGPRQPQTPQNERLVLTGNMSPFIISTYSWGPVTPEPLASNLYGGHVSAHIPALPNSEE